jgi:hypothetical protein
MAFEKGIAQTIHVTTYLAADHVTPTAPGTPVGTISVDGGATFGAPAGTVTARLYGLEFALTAADCNHDEVILRVTSANCDPVVQTVFFEAGWTAGLATGLGAQVIAQGAVAAGFGPPTAWAFGTNLVQPRDQCYRDATVRFTSGVLAGQQARVLSSNVLPSTLLMDRAFTDAPGLADTFVLLVGSALPPLWSQAAHGTVAAGATTTSIPVALGYVAVLPDNFGVGDLLLIYNDSVDDKGLKEASLVSAFSGAPETFTVSPAFRSAPTEGVHWMLYHLPLGKVVSAVATAVATAVTMPMATVVINGGATPEDTTLAVRRGDTSILTLTFTALPIPPATTGLPVNLTAYTTGAGTLHLTIKSAEHIDDDDDTNKVLQVDGTSAAPATGVAAFAFTAAQTELLDPDVIYAFDVQGDAGGAGTNIVTLLAGTIRSLRDVTRGSTA